MDKDEIMKLMRRPDGVYSKARRFVPAKLGETDQVKLETGKTVWVQQFFSRDCITMPAEWLNNICQKYTVRVTAINTTALPDGGVFMLVELAKAAEAQADG